jgi:hypothetical protein
VDRVLAGRARRGDGANTVYGFDRFRDGEIVEGDWIGLNRDELIAHGNFSNTGSASL